MVLEEVVKLIDTYIKELNDEAIYNLYKTLPIGKQLRSKLILNIAKNSKDVLNLAAIIEMIHLASLLHDDVIDDADTRRGKASFNAEFGNKNAIMVGDVLYSYGFFKLTNLPTSISKCVSNSVSLLSIGEFNDILLSSQMNICKEKYLKMIYQKTASLIEASAKAAAILEGLNEDDFALYGKNLGIAFQIVDDILDIVSDDKTLGKPAFNDLKEGKMTLPYIYVYEKCDEKEKEHFRTLYKKELSQEEKSWIKETMNKYGSIDQSILEAKKLGFEAVEAIKKYNISGLEKVVMQMIDREF